ncbi:hypothetical protein [Shimia sp. FJ5]|uniref:hypothetical protein n=1 Tax=Shimia sp. FJ5 TaxID=3079054 RepID=UPI002942B743|nr:hypothetical protein [Shimia sp. FJ5]
MLRHEPKFGAGVPLAHGSTKRKKRATQRGLMVTKTAHIHSIGVDSCHVKFFEVAATVRPAKEVALFAVGG